MRSALALLFLLTAAACLFTLSDNNPAQAQPAPTSTATPNVDATFAPQATDLA